jgi:hypothetical protein
LKYMFDLLNLNDANMEKIKKICEEWDILPLYHVLSYVQMYSKTAIVRIIFL